MAVYPIKCYFNTGITGGDALDSIALLDALFDSKTYDSVWLLQDRYRGAVKINAVFDDIKNCDYCVIGSNAYHVTTVKMLNENVAQLDLVCDYLTTAGINSIEVIEGWCMRRNPTNDTLFSNVIPESFQPMEELEIDIGNVIKPSTLATDDYRIVISTVQLDSAERLAESYTDGQTDLVVTVPQIPLATTPTIFSIGSGDDRKQYILPVGTAYNYSAQSVQKGIQSVRSLGIDACISASYTIPAEYVGLGSLENAQHGEIGGIDNIKDSALPVKYQSAINNKVYSGQFMKYGIMSLVTGDTQEFQPEEIYHDEKIQWRIMADPLPSGKPYAMPAYYYNNLNDRFYGNVNGGEWQQNAIEYAQASGAGVEYAKYARSIQRKVAVAGGIAVGAVIAGALPAVAGAVAAAPIVGASAAALSGAGAATISGIGTSMAGIASTYGAATAAAAGAGGVVGGIQAATEIGSNITNYLLERKTRELLFRAPDVAFNPVGSMQNYFGNTFVEFRTRLSKNDSERFDKFLTANGYAVSEPFQAQYMSTHTNFNYVMVDNARIRTRWGLTFDTAIAQQLQAGVRIWHTAPSQERLYNNPIKGGN